MIINHTHMFCKTICIKCIFFLFFKQFKYELLNIQVTFKIFMPTKYNSRSKFNWSNASETVTLKYWSRGWKGTAKKWISLLLENHRQSLQSFSSRFCYLLLPLKARWDEMMSRSAIDRSDWELQLLAPSCAFSSVIFSEVDVKTNNPVLEKMMMYDNICFYVLLKG